MVIVRFKIGQNERRIKEMSAKSIANEREELVDKPRFRPTRQRSGMQHRPDALPPESLCKLPSLVFPDVYLEQLLRPTVAWERVEQRRQERMRGHTQSDSSATHAKTLRFPSSLCRWNLGNCKLKLKGKSSTHPLHADLGLVCPARIQEETHAYT